MADYNFVRFTSRGSKLGNYKVSINKSRTIGLLGGFYNRERIMDYKKVVLFFDKAKEAIAMSFTNDDNAEGAFSIFHNKPGKNSASVGAISFFVANDLIKNEYLGQKIPRKIKDEKLGTLFVVDLV